MHNEKQFKKSLQKAVLFRDIAAEEIDQIIDAGHFGETSLLTNSRNRLNVRAMSDLSLLCYDADTFNSVLLNNKYVLPGPVQRAAHH